MNENEVVSLTGWIIEAMREDETGLGMGWVDDRDQDGKQVVIDGVFNIHTLADRLLTRLREGGAA